nr:hypothetical protein Hi04_10k_c554_00012 [uncultured bacterium]
MTATASHQLHERIAALIRGDTTSWEGLDVTPEEWQRFCDDQGLSGLVYYQLRGAEGTDWPAEVRDDLEQTARGRVAQEILLRRELNAALALLADGGVHPILLKGTALAYSCYPAPGQRPREDTDLLIRRDDVERVRAILRGHAYREPAYCDGELLFCQFEMQKLDQFGFSHALDFHWKISTQALFANLLSYDELAETAVAIPSLGPDARAPGLLHSLLLACVHPVMHHRGEERLLWVYDVHLLASGLSSAEWDTFVTLARLKRVSAICHAQLLLATSRFGTPAPPEILETLGSESADEPTVAYLSAGRRWHDEVESNLRGLRTWRERLQLLREIALPSASYMMKSYHLPDRALTRTVLPLLYAVRGIRGVIKVVRGIK